MHGIACTCVTCYMYMYTDSFIAGMLVNDSLGHQIMKLQQLILTSEVGYSV